MKNYNKSTLGDDWSSMKNFFYKQEFINVLDSYLKNILFMVGPVTGIHLISGAVAGGISRTITAPMDRLKISLQVMPYSQRIKPKHLLKNIIKKEGYKALFYGNGVNCLKVVPETAIKFTFYDWIKRQIIKYRHANQEVFINVYQSLETENAIALSRSEKFIAGGIAGALAQAVVYPLDLMKTHLALGKNKVYTGLVDCGTQILRQNGPASFYRGYKVSLAGVFLYSGINLCTYESLKKISNDNNHTFSYHTAFLYGATSTTLAQIASYPFALIRTRLQANNIMQQCGNQTNGFKLFYHILRYEHATILYRGLLPNMLKSVPAISIGWTVYEACKRFMNQKYLTCREEI